MDWILGLRVGDRGVTSRNRNRHRRRLAMTRSEVVATVVCVSLLVLIMAPGPRRVRDEANRLVCQDHLRTLGQASDSFASQHDGLLQITGYYRSVAEADPNQDKYAYGGGEILTWPVALAQAVGFNYQTNWDWGVRADNYVEASAKQAQMDTSFDALTCPSHVDQIGAAFYPRGYGLTGEGDQNDPHAVTNATSYWGRFSYAVNEDIWGADMPHEPAVGRYVQVSEDLWLWAKGESSIRAGSRLQGRLADVVDPSTVGLMFEAPTERRVDPSDTPDDNWVAINLFSSARSRGPYMGDVQSVWQMRLAINRHAGGRQNVLFADYHVETVRPVAYIHSLALQQKVPSEYNPRVRVSPYFLPDFE